MIDVDSLRSGARERALHRRKMPFHGEIEEATAGDRPVRIFAPSPRSGSGTVYFAHGGYGLFGDLDLQDGYCRLLSEVFGWRTVSVDYRLAPEHTFEQSAADLARVLRADQSSGPRLLCGDSAGGALCAAVADQLGPRVDGLLLTNPNLDLSLESFDHAATKGPDGPLSRFAFERWCPGPAHARRILQRAHDFFASLDSGAGT